MNPVRNDLAEPLQKPAILTDLIAFFQLNAYLNNRHSISNGMNRAPVKVYTTLLAGLLIASIVGFLVIISGFDPAKSRIAVLLLYLDVFFLVLSLSSLSAFYLRSVWGQREHSRRHFLVSFRQGLWFSILVVISMNLQAFGLFSTLNALFLAIALVFLEAYFLYNKRT